MEDREVDEGVGGHEEVGQQGGHGLEVTDQDATHRDAENLSIGSKLLFLFGMEHERKLEKAYK